MATSLGPALLNGSSYTLVVLLEVLSIQLGGFCVCRTVVAKLIQLRLV